jgi:YbgC/YbaW family acyl-CoA thioester hydrolase
MLTINKKINFYDCDPAGILFYGNIFFFCHSAYEELIASYNLKEEYWLSKKFVVPIFKSSADYLKPIKCSDEIIIELNVTELRKSSFELSYKCKNRLGELCAEVKTVHVFLDKNTWKKKGLIPELREGLKTHLAG